MSRFEEKYNEWMQRNMEQEVNHRRRELLEKGLGHGTVEFLRTVWYPSVGNFDHLYPEWEVLKEETMRCRQLVLAFVGRFLSTEIQPELSCFEAETIRFARRLLRPFTPLELAAHLRVTDRHARKLLHALLSQDLLVVVSGKERYRLYALRNEKTLFTPK